MDRKMMAEELRKFATRVEEGRIHAFGIAAWGVTDEDDPDKHPYSQTVVWEDPSEEVPASCVQLIGAISMLKMRVEHDVEEVVDRRYLDGLSPSIQ